MTDDTAGEIHVLFNLLEVRAHVIGVPRVITGKTGDVRPITVMSGDGDEGIVTGAATESTSTGIKNTQRLRTLRRVESSIVATICLLVDHLGVLLLLLFVRVVIDEVVPSSLFELSRHEMQGGKLLNPVVARVTTSIDEKDFEASDGEVGRDRATTCTRTDDYIVIFNSGIAFADERIMRLRRRTANTINVSVMP